MGSLPRGRDGEWLDFVADVMAAPLTSWPTERVARLFVETFDALGCFYSARSAGGDYEQFQWPPQLFAEHLGEITHYSMYEAPTRDPLLRYYLGTGDHRCMQVADVPARFAGERVLAEWRERADAWGGVRAQVAMPLRAGPGGHRSFLVGRVDRFTTGDMATTHRLQRLLVGIDRQISTFSRWSRLTGPAGVEVAEAVCLTPRELAVLELLAESLTAAAIGRRLQIAERTVQKHLQRSYAKLGVADRLGAVRRAQTIGVLHRP
jgi:DNA-binding CsgD family transcriptional regulator